VVTDTLGSPDSVFSETVISGDASGDGLELSSWARANGGRATRSAARARMTIFIGFVL
jgi:hypothetical protein